MEAPSPMSVQPTPRKANELKLLDEAKERSDARKLVRPPPNKPRSEEFTVAALTKKAEEAEEAVRKRLAFLTFGSQTPSKRKHDAKADEAEKKRQKKKIRTPAHWDDGKEKKDLIGPKIKQIITDKCDNQGVVGKCHHLTKVVYEDGKEETRGVMGGQEIWELYQTHDIRDANREHFFPMSQAYTQKMRQQYHKTKGAQKSEGPPATVAAAEKAAQAAIVRRTRKPVQKNVTYQTRVGLVTGNRGLGNRNKQRRKRWVKPKGAYEVVVQNTVYKVTGCASISGHDLKETFFGAYEPKKFPSMTAHLSDPMVTVTLTATCEQSYSGATSRSEALLASYLVADHLGRQYDLPFMLYNAGAVNWTTSANFGWRIDLKKLYRLIEGQGRSVMYNPVKFRGLHWTLTSGAVLVFFTAGAINAVGLKSKKQFEMLKTQVLPWLNQNRVYFELVDEEPIAAEATEAQNQEEQTTRTNVADPPNVPDFH